MGDAVKMYYIGGYTKKIEPIEVEKRTDKTIWYTSIKRNGAKYTSQRRINNSEWFETFEDARKFLIERASRSIGYHEKQIMEERNKIEILKVIQE